jgi:hypothetical protein
MAAAGKIQANLEEKPFLFWVGEEEAETVDIMGVVPMPKSLVESTKKTIIDSYNAKLSLPNIIQNTYSPAWHDVKPALFKEWVKVIINEHVLAGKAEEEVTPLHFSDMGKEKKADVTASILTGIQSGFDYAKIKKELETTYPELEWDSEIEDIVNGLIEKWHEEVKEAAGPPPFEEPELVPWGELTPPQQQAFANKVKETGVAGWDELKQAAIESGIIPDEDELPTVLDLKAMAGEKEKAPPPMPEKALDETISSFVQMGWSPKGVTEFLSDEGDPKLILKKAKKIYDIYKPELRPVIYPYAELNPAVKAHLDNVAAMMLAEGKSQEDTAWYIAHNYSVDKDTVKPVVHEIAKKPLSQVELTVKAMKLMGVGEYIGGCELVEKPTKLVPQTVAYCQGIMDKKGKTGPGEVVVHQGNTQLVNIVTNILDSKWESTLVYAESKKEDNWQERLDGLPDILADLLGENSECVQVGVESSITCIMKGTDGMAVSIADQDRLRRAALFLSQIDNVAKLEKSCIPKALQFAKEKAINVNQTSKPWTVSPYPNKVEDWEQVVCSK